MEMILACRKDGLLGSGNNLAYHIKEDLQFFKETTMGKICVMGSKTYESLPKNKLPNREIIILSRNKNYKGNFGEKIISDWKEILSMKNIIICGGNEIYNLFLPYVDTIYLSELSDSSNKSVDNPIYFNVSSISNIEYKTIKKFKVSEEITVEIKKLSVK